MMYEFDGTIFKSTRVSDVDRDGMLLELAASDKDTPILEAFYDCQLKQMTFRSINTWVPLEMVEKFLKEAKLRLSSEVD